MKVCYETILCILVYWRVYALGPQYTNLTWTVSIEYIAHLVLILLETSDARTVLLLLFNIVTLRAIPSLTGSLISPFPHITTSLNDTFVCFLFCWVLRVICCGCVNLTQCYNQSYRWMLSQISNWSFRMLYSLRIHWMLQLSS